MPCGTEPGWRPAGITTSHRIPDGVEEPCPLWDPFVVAVVKFLLGMSIATDSDMGNLHLLEEQRIGGRIS